jgi:hypothetical protein
VVCAQAWTAYAVQERQAEGDVVALHCGTDCWSFGVHCGMDCDKKIYWAALHCFVGCESQKFTMYCGKFSLLTCVRVFSRVIGWAPCY